jgi:hypothetical protein
MPEYLPVTQEDLPEERDLHLGPTSVIASALWPIELFTCRISSDNAPLQSWCDRFRFLRIFYCGT